MDKQALELRITNAERELARMRKLLESEEGPWQPEDIVPGRVAKAAEGHQRCMVLPHEYSYGTKMFIVGGARGNPFKVFSIPPKTAVGLAEYFNKQNLPKGEVLKLKF